MIWLIAKREIVTRARSRGFQMIMLVFFLAAIGAGILPRLIVNDDAREVTIGLTAEAAPFAELLAVGTPSLDPSIEIIEGFEEDPASLFEDGEISAVFAGDSITWERLPDLELDAYIRDLVQREALSDRAQEMGLGSNDVSTLLTPVDIEEIRLDGGGNEFAARSIVAGVAAFGTFVLLVTWGSFMTLGVIEEKSSRVIEILLSQVRPSTLLGGKLIGLGVLAFVQMSMLALGAMVTLLTWESLEVPSGVWGVVPLMLLTFVFGFAFYATGYAAVGSMVPRVEDAQSVQGVMTLPLMVGYLVAAVNFTNPDNTIVTAASFFPPTAPVIIPFRMALVEPPIWQPILSLGILAISTVLMLRVAGAIYRSSLLRTGSRVSWRQAWANRKLADA